MTEWNTGGPVEDDEMTWRINGNEIVYYRGPSSDIQVRFDGLYINSRREPMAQFQQGDVLVTSISDFSSDLPRREAEDGRVVVVRGEKTGHAHTLDAEKVEAYEGSDGQLYLKVGEETELTHDEHNPITLQPGKYQVDLQREYVPDRANPQRESERPMAFFD